MFGKLLKSANGQVIIDIACLVLLVVLLVFIVSRSVDRNGRNSFQINLCLRPVNDNANKLLLNAFEVGKSLAVLYKMLTISVKY